MPSDTYHFEYMLANTNSTKPDEIIATLNAFGEDRWEVINVQTASEGLIFLLKRYVEPDNIVYDPNLEP